ncbi:MAG: sulfurtransferase [Bacillus sp. (in: firmicutes)]
MTIIMVAIGLAISVAVYRRYIPIMGIPCKKMLEDDVLVVDIRDYNSPSVEWKGHAVHLPVAYLHRHYGELLNRKVHILAADQIEKNIGIRLLRKKGVNVVSYTLSECDCIKENAA